MIKIEVDEKAAAECDWRLVVKVEGPPPLPETSVDLQEEDGDVSSEIKGTEFCMYK